MEKWGDDSRPAGSETAWLVYNLAVTSELTYILVLRAPPQVDMPEVGSRQKWYQEPPRSCTYRKSIGFQSAETIRKWSSLSRQRTVITGVWSRIFKAPSMVIHFLPRRPCFVNSGLLDSAIVVVTFTYIADLRLPCTSKSGCCCPYVYPNSRKLSTEKHRRYATSFVPVQYVSPSTGCTRF